MFYFCNKAIKHLASIYICRKINKQIMTNELYHADTSHISKSGLDEIRRSPAHYYAKYLDPDRKPRKETEAFLQGSILHKLVLEPDTFDKEFTTIPDDAPNYPTATQWNAKKPSEETVKAMHWWKHFETFNKGKKIIDKDNLDAAKRMRDAIMKHPAASYLLSQTGVAEETILFDDPQTGAPCKCRPDFRPLHTNYLLDIKTTEDAGPDSFGRSALSYSYDVQAPFYINGVNEYLGHIQYEEFIFICVEKEPPYAVAVYHTPQEVLEHGYYKYQRDLEVYQQCRRTGIWPAYSPKIERLRYPQWALNK